MDSLPRHYLRACLLLLIRCGPGYGYNLRERLVDLGVVQNDWGRLYRTLRVMEREGHLLSCWENSEAGPSRRTYHVTEKGRAELDRWVQGVAEAQGLVDRFLARYESPAAGAGAGGGGGDRREVSNL